MLLLASPRGEIGRLKAAKAKRRVDDLHQQRCQDVAIAPVRGLLAHPGGQNAVARPQNKDASGKGQLRDRQETSALFSCDRWGEMV